MVIQINSRIHICFHEAGHIEAAYLWGGTVDHVVIDDSLDYPHTRVNHKEDLSTKDPVACGGYALESLLFRAGKLVDQSNRPLSQQVFKCHAMQNASRDKYPFYIKQSFDSNLGIYPGSPYQPINGSWPDESDEPFITYAEQHVIPVLQNRLEVIEALALALNRHGQLTRTEIESIRASGATSSDI